MSWNPNSTRGHYLWAIDRLTVSHTEWDGAFNQITANESIRLHKCRMVEDRQLRLLSLLLQKSAIREYLALTNNVDIAVLRTTQVRSLVLYLMNVYFDFCGFRTNPILPT